MAEITVAALCRSLGLQRYAVDEAIRRERITSWRRDERGRIWIDEEKATREFIERTDPGAAADNGKFREIEGVDAVDLPSGDLSPLEQLKRETLRIRRAQADREEIKRDVERGLLVAREEVQKIAFDSARIVRDALKAVPDRIAPVLASEDDQNEIRRILNLELDAALNGLVTALPDAVLR